MIVFLALLGLVFVLVYFATLGRRPNDGWQRFRRRFRDRRRLPPPEQGIDPTFRFDEPSTDITGASFLTRHNDLARSSRSHAAGKWQGELERPEQGEYEQREPLP